MQTRCPHCDTRFRLTESQLSMADGFVRCGVCREVFNALSVDDDDTDKQTPDDTAGVDNAFIDTLHFQADTVAADTAPQAEQSDSLAAEPAATRDDSPEAAAAADSYDLFNEDHNQTLSHVVPDHLRNDGSGSSTLSTVLWSLAILLLTAALFVEYAWFNRERLAQLPQLQDFLLETCLQYDCSQFSLRDSSKLELLSRNVYSHPQQKQALKIDLSFRNNSEFAQPWPLMQVVFSDRRGKPVAARRFSPQEYLGGEIQGNIAPGENVTISMEIHDPGKQAATYEFDFL